MNKTQIEQRLSNELKSFDGLWDGGYFEGEVLDPVAHSTYGPLGYISCMHALYLMSIKPYVNKESIALEIGPGRGAFSKAILQNQPKELWCLDAVSAKENGFFDYVGKAENVKYIKVEDFSCSDLPDNYFNYLFSFGALCHVSFDGITQYLTNLYPKLKKGAECFIMVADYGKYNLAMENIENLSVYKNLPFSKIIKINWWLYKKRFKRILSLRREYPETVDPSPGRWFHAGTDKTCELLESLGYIVVSKDIGVTLRDPVIHFRKP